MTLITKLEDTVEGLTGLTVGGERVHLGIPSLYSHVQSLDTDDFKLATRRYHAEAESFEKKLAESDSKRYHYFNKDSCECVRYHIVDTPTKRFFGDKEFKRNYNVELTYLSFETEKERSYQHDSDRYLETNCYDERRVPIYRAPKTN